MDREIGKVVVRSIDFTIFLPLSIFIFHVLHGIYDRFKTPEQTFGENGSPWQLFWAVCVED
jgi:hypothetical protein